MFEWNDGTALYHYGIQGMKWGVRNGPPYPIDHKTMYKGTKLSSVSGYGKYALANELLSYQKQHGKIDLNDPMQAAGFYKSLAKQRKLSNKALYTYNPDDPHDSAIYKGPFAFFLNVGRGADYVVEHQYEVVKDLKMPTKAERVQEFKDLYADRKYQKRMAKELDDVRKRLVAHNIGSKSQVAAMTKFSVKDLIKNGDWDTAYYIFNHAMEASHSFKSTSEYMRRMASKYDAMVDDNNQGVYNDAHDPVIIFRANEALKEIGGNIVTTSELNSNYNKIEAYLAQKGESVKL